MPTRKCYEENAYQRSFTAQVLSCQPKGNRWAVELDQTCFFPEGGGQPWDTGTLGEVRVTEVHSQGDSILHLTDAPLEPGCQVTGRIDWQRRFALTQQHSGEHIVSGLIHSRYGFENVGFHMGSQVMTVDWNGVLTWEQLQEIELAANQVIWENRETEIFYPTPEELAQLSYRSKKELEGQVRIVRFPGADTCACCGTHVARAGEVGLIRILSVKQLRGGIRCELVAGGQALAYDRMVWAQNHQISVLLSAKEGETAEAVRRLHHQRDALAYQRYGLVEEKLTRLAEDCRGQGNTLLWQEGFTPEELRRLALAASEACGGVAVALSPKEDGGTAYCLAAQTGDLRPLCQALNQSCSGRGGGKPQLVQGSANGDRGAFEDFFRAQGWTL